MSKINIKMMSDVTFATLKKNIDSYVENFKENSTDSSWINNITTESAFNIKKYQIEDFELKVPENYNDHNTELQNAIILYEHLNCLPAYVLAEPKFWMWIMFEKGYETSLKSMEKIDATSFKHQWLFADGLRRGLFFGVLSRLYYRVDLTYCMEEDDPYYLTKYVMENPNRFREISWRTISNQKFVVKSMLRAERRVNNELEFTEKGEYFAELAKDICKLGSIKLIDAMDEKDVEDYIYDKYKSIILNGLEKTRFNSYSLGLDLMKQDSESSIKKAMKIFNELGNYKNSNLLLAQCVESRNKYKKKSFLDFLKK